MLYNTSQRGFSVVELLVSVSIFALITTAVIVSQNAFGEKMQLNNLAYEVALSIRQAQVYGTSVRSIGGTSDVAYGVHFSDATPRSYILFADTNRNGVYESGTDTDVESYTLQKGNHIAEFCVWDGGTPNCSGSGGDHVDISFERPNPAAIITSSLFAGNDAYARARITVRSPKGYTRIVEVYQSGQITVRQP